MVGWSGGKGGACRRARRQQGGWRSNPVRQGFGGHRTVALTVGMHSIPIGWRHRMSTMPRPFVDRLAHSPFDRTAFRVASGPGYPHEESACGALTVEIHSAASGFRRGISTSENARFGGPPSALAVRTHRGEREFAGWTSSPEHAGRAIVGSLSPLKYTGLRLAGGVVVHVRNCVASRPYARSHH